MSYSTKEYKCTLLLKRLKYTKSDLMAWYMIENHWHTFTWIWERYHAWYQRAVNTGREMGAGRSLNHWIIESADYLQPIKMLIISTEFFSVLTQSGWVFCIVHCMMQSAMIAYINVQCILDCLPVSVSTEPVYSDDQCANSYSNPHKLYINVENMSNSWSSKW